MATSIYENQVYTLFVAYFGRPPYSGPHVKDSFSPNLS